MAEHGDTHDSQETTGTPSETSNPSIALEAAAKDGNTSEVISLLRGHISEPDAELTLESLKALALQHAAESGHAELVAELLKLGIDAESRETVLRIAAKSGHASVTKVLLKYQRALPVWPYLYRKGKWMTGFLDAVAFGHIATVKVMLDAGLSANLKYQCAECISNTQTRCGICRSETAIWLAAHNGRGEIVELLLARGASPRAEPKAGATALHRAAERGDGQMVHELLRAGWDVYRADMEKKTPVYHAAVNSHTAVFDTLVKNGGQVGRSEAHWLRYLIHTRNSNALVMILAHLPPATFEFARHRRGRFYPGEGNPLKQAVETGDVAVTRCILEYNKRHAVLAAFDYVGGFRSATGNSNEALLEVLVEYCPWTDKRTREEHVFNAVEQKAMRGHLNSVLVLLEWHYEFGRCPALLVTALFTAVYHGQTATVAGLIATAGANVNEHVPDRTLAAIIPDLTTTAGAPVYCRVPDPAYAGRYKHTQLWDGDCPLHVAARKGSAVMCKILLEHGADVNSRGYDGYTPLHVAASRLDSSSTATLQVLLDHGADLEATCRRRGETPIHCARGAANIKCLYKAGANLDYQDKWGKTALYWAGYVGDFEKYECLVGLGADESLRDKDGVSARECYEAKLEKVRNKKKCTCSRSRMRTLCTCNL